MAKFSLMTKKTVEYRVLVEAKDVQEAQRILDDMVDEDFNDFAIGADWADGEWEQVEEKK
ncbi:hypothetical protein UFOVP536_60 [uncultured Caudovirales phage]|uniref:Uncharacterized protein n=1 Tax=uncultured Caudovirales phage TaxID=2100421 RepID=A0A6J5MW82_9CAUD|nr:hypothetical protein UFOVP536_60 [uncultured Caudovirales phage]